jgi:hypothetical protein
MEDALKEIERCVTELKLSLLSFPTHFLNKKGEGLSIADESAFPIFELTKHY